jgi:hypothetical protein
MTTTKRTLPTVPYVQLFHSDCPKDAFKDDSYSTDDCIETWAPTSSDTEHQSATTVTNDQTSELTSELAEFNSMTTTATKRTRPTVPSLPCQGSLCLETSSSSTILNQQSKTWAFPESLSVL